MKEIKNNETKMGMEMEKINVKLTNNILDRNVQVFVSGISMYDVEVVYSGGVKKNGLPKIEYWKKHAHFLGWNNVTSANGEADAIIEKLKKKGWKILNISINNRRQGK